MQKELEQSLHRVERKNRVIYLVAGMISLIAFATIGVFIYWTSYPGDVLQIHKKPVPVATKTVAPGGIVAQVYDLCKLVKAKGRVQAQLVSSLSAVTLPAYDDNLEPGCHANVPVFVPLSPQMREDVWHLHYTVTYQVNPLRTITEEWNSESFRVVADK